MASRDIRLFKCECGHKMRFGARKCSSCYFPSSWMNRKSTYTLMLVGISLLALALFALK